MKIVTYFIVLVLSIISGLWLKDKSGFIHLEYQDFVIEMPIWLGVIGIVATNIVILSIIDILKTLYNIPSIIGLYFRRRRHKQALKNSELALLELFNKNYEQSFKYANKALNQDKDITVPSFIAAKSANHLEKYRLRDRILNNINDISKKERLQIELMRVRFELEQKNPEKALKLINILERYYGKNSNLVKPKIDILKNLNKWEDLYKMLSYIKKTKVLSEEHLYHLSCNIHQKLLEYYIQQNLKAKIFALWNNIPNKIKEEPSVLNIYFKYLIDNSFWDLADREYKYYIKRIKDNEFLLQGTNINNYENKDRIKLLEKLLEKDRKNPYLLLTIGKICIQEKLWGKAKDYLNASLSIEKSRQIYTALIDLSEQLGENENINQYYKAAFSFCS